MFFILFKLNTTDSGKHFHKKNYEITSKQIKINFFLQLCLEAIFKATVVLEIKKS